MQYEIPRLFKAQGPHISIAHVGQVDRALLINIVCLCVICPLVHLPSKHSPYLKHHKALKDLSTPGFSITFDMT